MSTSLNPLIDALTAPGANMSPDQAVEQLLGQMDPSDPRVRLVSNVLARRRSAPAAAVDEPNDATFRELEVLVREAQARAEHAARAEVKLRGIVGDVMDELQILRERNDLLAAALGACYLCWGEDAQCPVCRGAGHPGSTRPEPHLFSRLIAPAMQASSSTKTTTQPENRA